MATNQLIQQLASGEPTAFEQLYDLMGKRLYHYLLGQLRSPQEAEDLLQTVFLRLVRYRDKFAKVKDLECYVFIVARNELMRTISKFRDKNTTTEVELVCLPAGESDSAEKQEQLNRLNSALLKLPPEQVEVVSLKTWHNLTFEQIASVLGVNSNTVASRYRYAIEKLRELLEEKDERQLQRA